MENRIKVYIMGAAAVVVSGTKLEDWKLVEKYTPEALQIVSGEGEPLFRVETASGTGSMNRYGVVWGSHTGEDGGATVTILIDDDVEDKKEAVLEVIGTALLDLQEIEERLPEVLEEIHGNMQKMESYITQVHGGEGVW